MRILSALHGDDNSFGDMLEESMNDNALAGGHRSSYQEPQRAQIDTYAIRVCDKCMKNKRKCNRQRPTCSRCAEEDGICVYSSTKRKPGPVKGSRRKKPTTSEAVVQSDITSNHQHIPSHDLQTHYFPPPLATAPPAQSIVSQNISINSYSYMENQSPCSAGAVSQEHDDMNPMIPLQPEQVHSMLESFFTYVHPSLMLFDRDVFLQRHAHGLISSDLLLTILAMSSHIQGHSALWANPSLKTFLDQLLATRSLEAVSLGDSTSLSRFQQACLLAFYEFHQYPGSKAWRRISELTRGAYQCGLHQIDNRDQCHLYNCVSMTVEEVAEWRRLWWCIYCFDSYCNITANTPFIIDLDSLRTAVISESPSVQDHREPADPIFLPTDTATLWQTTKAISCRPSNSRGSVHIVTTTLLREAGKLLRIWRQNPSTRTEKPFALLDDHLSAVKLALPLRYLDVSRDVSADESQAEHHARLICVLHLHATRLLISLPRSFGGNEQQWRQNWLSTLETCEDCVSIVKQWKAHLCLSVDPAICFIASGVLSLLHLHSVDVANSQSVEFLARLQVHKELLRLFLEHFASVWHLPRLLLVSFQKFSALFSHPMTATEIAELLNKMQGPLHQNWLKFLSITLDDLQPPISQEFDLGSLSEEGFIDWETWANVPNMNFISEDIHS